MKHITALISILFWSVACDAQLILYQLTATSGSQTIGGKTVTITPNGGLPGFPAACLGVKYRLHGGSSFNYSFSTPVYYTRFHVTGMDDSANTVDVASFYLNNIFYPLSSQEVTTVPNSCGVQLNYTPVVVNGKLQAIQPSIGSTTIQIDISSSSPINSLEVAHVPINGNGFQYNMYFADTGTFFYQPLLDTLKCPGDSLYLPYRVYAPFNTGNVFTVQLSDASGSFTSPTSIGMLTSGVPGTIGCKLPQNLPPGSGYRVRIMGSNPVRISDPNDTAIHILASPSAIPVATANTPCAGSTLNLGSTNAGTGVSYNWIGPNSYTATGQTPGIINAQTSHSGDYIVTASIGSCSRKDTVTATVKPMPATPTTANNGPLCPGDSLGLTGNSATGGVGYSWSGPASFTSSLQNPFVLGVNSGHGGIYSVTATLNGCTSTAGTTSVTIKPTPATPTAGSNSPVCAGGALNLSANSATGGVSYNWNGPNGFSSTTQNPSVSPAGLNAAGTYTVTASLNGCTSASGSATVAVNNVSSIGAYPSPNDTICQMNPFATLVAVPFNGGGSPQLQWFKNGNPISGATSPSYAASGVAQGDTFYCRMTALGVCTDPLVLYSPKIGLTVLPPAAAPGISIAANPGNLLSPWQTVTFTATPGGNTGSDPKYQWKRNGSDIIGATSNTWSANNLADNDEISCAIISSAWCANPANDESNKIAVHIKTGVNDIAGNSFYRVYPNPAANELTIEGAAGMQVSILNVLGQEVYSGVMTTVKDVINISQLAPGHYVLQLLGADGSRSVVKVEKE
ncbi:T9SS type A sorting domain-containing protein [Polluticoccus soli]|uniref:Ig-like domain-containing protein n=1 Tax=Polluticoccus soli TaxID=3034150 RepID=UPI0023E2BA61|nr:T9SS type A sorting domain-containing protein [Flavipsychrobacter sp. JY13-12]